MYLTPGQTTTLLWSFTATAAGEVKIGARMVPVRGTSRLNVDKAIKQLRDNPKAHPTNNCARYVRQALEAGEVDMQGHPSDARQYGQLMRRARSVRPSNSSIWPTG